MYSFEFARSVTEVPDWDLCAGTANPFVSRAFLGSLEESGCVGPESGWIPRPAVVKKEGRVEGVAPCYLKLHSQGEYIFDYHWADAYERLLPEGESYYPKLQVAVPFTPVPGPRLLVHPEASSPRSAREALLVGLQAACRELGCSSVHLTFCREQEFDLAERAGYLQRLGEQYHWFNEGYRDFDDFLQSLTSRKRKTVRRERKKAQSHGLTIRTVHGDELEERQLLAFFRMYERTCMGKWGRPYLNLEFFRLLARRLGRRMVLFLAESPVDGRAVAGAWNLRGDTTLFGRNWGCLEFHDLLHFEVCYYRAIEYAIANGLERVEAGAQGLHKVQRGYRPRPIYSVHHFESAPFRQAISRYLEAEREETEYRLEALTSLEPFKAVDSSTGFASPS